MQLIIDNEDLTQFYTTATWSGELGQAARTLEFGLVVSGTDQNLPKPTVTTGGRCIFKNDEGKVIFTGEVIEKEKSVTSNTMTVKCMDPLLRANQTEGSFSFVDKTPGHIAKEVFSSIDIPTGFLEEGQPISRQFDMVPIYNMAMIAYKLDYEKSGIPYIIRMMDGKVNVEEKGKIVAKYELDPKANLLDATFRESGENVVSTVNMYDTEGKLVGSIEGEGKGITKLYRQEENEDLNARAKGLLQGLEREASVKVLGDFDLITGNAVVVKEPFTGLSGKFYIDGDTHTFEGNTHKVELKLSYQNMMQDIDTSEKTDSPTTGGNATTPKGGGSKETKALEIGKNLTGTHYKWGGNSPKSGLDCTGFVDWCYTQAGMPIPGRLTSSALVTNPKQFNLVEIPFSERRPGDVLWKKGHCALQYYDGNILESGGTSKKVLGYSGVAVTSGKGRRFSKAYRYIGG